MKQKDLTKDKEIKVLISLALPIMGSSLLQFTYNLIDMIFVGKLGSDAVASIGSSSFFVNLGYAINALIVIGTGIKAAHSIGEKDNLKLKEYINSGLVLNFIIGVVYALILIIAGRQLIGLLNLNNIYVEEQSYIYLIISAITLLFIFYNTLYIRLMNSFGNNELSLKISAIGVIINLILDPFLIYFFKFGVAGAGIATLIANVIMYILFKVKTMDTFKFDKSIGISLIRIKDIIRLGLPNCIQRVLFNLINIILARLIGSFGSDAIAAHKIGLQIESVGFMIIGGLNGAVLSFTGQNYGAKLIKRIKRGYKAALYVGISYSFIMMAVFILFNENLIKLFIADRNTIKIASDYLNIVAFSQVFSTIEQVSNGLFTGIGKPKISSGISVTFTALRIPMAIVLINFFGLEGIWISIAFSSVLKGLSAYIMYRVLLRKELKIC
ncbi:MAG: MATE family efflux transporter [Clostridiaceae bacterium]|nr:MATE family efflux transporter [Clostridiaceae bacterium]